MDLDTTTSRLVSASLLRLRLRNPFFATLALFARIEASERLPTAATDGRDIFINQIYFQSLTPNEQDGLILHEVLHAALLHIPRRGQRDPLLWNIAADIVINGMIVGLSGLALPSGALLDRQLQHLRVEEVYEILQHDLKQYPTLIWIDLLDQAPDDCRGATTVPGAWSEERKRALETYWRYAYDQACIIAQSFGHGMVPAELDREFGALSAPQIDWRAYLWRYLVQTPTDFGDFDRRFVGQGLYLETITGESVHVLVCVDTSGSINAQQLSTFLGEVQGIVNAYPHLRCDLFYADSALHGPYELDPSIPPPIAIGGGGTDFRPFFNYVSREAELLHSVVCVYLTDGFGSFPEEGPNVPLLWVVTPGGRGLNQFPFGETVRLMLAE